MKLLHGKPTKLAAIQLQVVQDDLDYNLNYALELIRKASESGANIVCLPQTFGTGMNFPSIRRNSQEDDSSTILFTLQQEAQKYNIYIIFGMLEKCGNDYYDSAYILDKTGTVLGKYRRHSLLTEEAEFLSQGEPGQLIETEFGTIGLLLGYDIRFPISCQNYFKNKATIIICLSNMFIDYGYPIEQICRARAADNVCYFVYLNCVGIHKYVNTPYMGRSLILDGTYESLVDAPDSDIIAKAADIEDILYGDLYFKKMIRYQNKPTTRYYQDYKNFWVSEENS